MAITLTQFRSPNRSDLGNKFANLWTLALDNSYPTGGYAVTAAQLSLITIDQILVSGDQKGYTFGYVPATGKLIGYSTAATEIVNTTDLSAITGIHLIAIGT